MMCIRRDGAIVRVLPIATQAGEVPVKTELEQTRKRLTQSRSQ